jgi:hydrophobic/amphiphilic exporter-1 (mainly G- bacteria), HAE1 family
VDLIRFSIEKPVTVVVGVIFIILFGLVAFFGLPYQLSPNVTTPTITVSTPWPGASPYEIERDIIEEQEKVLKGLPHLDVMESTSSNGSGSITLRFDVGTKIEDAMLRVSNKLDEVPSYPENVDRPVLNATGAEASPVIYCVLRPAEGNERHIYTYRGYFEEEIKQFLERVEGVADVVVYGGVEPEMHVVIDPKRLSAYGITIPEVQAALRGENVNIAAGTLSDGRRDFRIRTLAEYRSPDDIANVIVVSDGERRIRIRDIAHVKFGYSKLQSPGLQDGLPGLTIATRPEPDANLLQMTDDMEVAVRQLNEGKLKQANLHIQWIYDQRPYIRGAISQLRTNIAIGAVFAIVVLVVFLRSISATIIVATSIPISVIGSFFIMNLLGTTLNVISLAGIAFAVGMLVDNAIVVLENIDRHRRMGKSAIEAAYDGTSEVWGAVLASSLTTVAVFLPIVFLKQEAGMLFRDIAVAVTAAVSISLLVSVTVIPMFFREIFEHPWIRKVESRSTGSSVFSKIGGALSGAMMAVVGLTMRNAVTRLATITLLVGGAVLIGWKMTPKMEYLPNGNRDLIFNIMIPPPGLSYDERMNIGQQLFEKLKPYYGEDTEEYPGIRQAFFAAPPGMLMLGIISNNQERTRELVPVCREITNSIPGVFGISNQSSIFGRGIGRGRTIDVNLSGTEIDTLFSSAGRMMGAIRGGIDEVQMRPVPSLDIMYPEANFIPDQDRLRALGMTAQDFAIGLDVLMDGRKIGEFKEEGKKKIDLVLKASESAYGSAGELQAASIPTPTGQAMPVSALSRMVETTGITSIRHLERNRTVTIQVTPPYSLTIQETMEAIQNEIVPELRKQGALDGIEISLTGTADKMTETRTALQWNFLMAIAITYLLMSALFGNFLYPFIIMLTVPLAGAGGLLGLKAVNLFVAPQQLDILTMLGFIILVGIVVNNAILIVHQSLNNIRIEGMQHKDAVLEAVRSRLRPIYMTATTSIFGMLPLVLWDGPGTELYRGLGSVVLGGLALSTIFTVFLIPSMLLFVIGMEKPARRAE